MRVLANMGNGYCGCDEEFLMTLDDDLNEAGVWFTILEAYTYREGFAGSEDYEEEAEEAGFASLDEFWDEMINKHSDWEIISEEDYLKYLELGYEER